MQNICELSSHSFRVDAAVDILDEGVPLERIMLRGGWKSEETVKDIGVTQPQAIGYTRVKPELGEVICNY